MRYLQIACRRKAANRFEDGALVESVAGREIASQRAGIDVSADPGERAQGLHLRGEGEASAGKDGIVEWLLTHAVARREQCSLVAVPDRKREHPVQLIETRRAAAAKQLQQDLGVAGGPEKLAGIQQFLPELTEIVDLAVEDDHIAAAVVDHRLVCSR